MTDQNERRWLFTPPAPDKANFDENARREELIRRFSELPAEQARRQVAVLPYYHQLENEITKPNQGVWTTRYFKERWRPALGAEAASIVEALRLLADRDTRHCTASMEEIARLAGLSSRTVKAWLSTNEATLTRYSPAWRQQWSYLHAYFILDKRGRARQAPSGKKLRDTSEITIALDDPIHPDDEGKLFIKVAERIVNDERSLAKPQENEGFSSRGTGSPQNETPKNIGLTPNQPLSGGTGSPASSVGHREPNRTLTYRSNAINVKASNAGLLTETSFREDSRVRRLNDYERERRDALAAEIGDWLHRKGGRGTTGPHKSAGFHRRVAYFVPEELIRQVMRDIDDRLAAAREGTKPPVRDVSGAFGGYISRVCQQQGISLTPRPERRSEGQ